MIPKFSFFLEVFISMPRRTRFTVGIRVEGKIRRLQNLVGVIQLIDRVNGKCYIDVRKDDGVVVRVEATQIRVLGDVVLNNQLNNNPQEDLGRHNEGIHEDHIDQDNRSADSDSEGNSSDERYGFINFNIKLWFSIISENESNDEESQNSISEANINQDLEDNNVAEVLPEKIEFGPLPLGFIRNAAKNMVPEALWPGNAASGRQEWRKREVNVVNREQPDEDIRPRLL